jgi:hypothetical protein
VREYTAAPIYFGSGADAKGSHEWVVEFERAPADVAKFAELLDLNLQKVNSDYEAKRYHGLALEPLHLHVAPDGTFYEWMKARGKFGAQQKVPRLANHRDFVEGILKMINGKEGG